MSEWVKLWSVLLWGFRKCVMYVKVMNVFKLFKHLFPLFQLWRHEQQITENVWILPYLISDSSTISNDGQTLKVFWGVKGLINCTSVVKKIHNKMQSFVVSTKSQILKIPSEQCSSIRYGTNSALTYFIQNVEHNFCISKTFSQYEVNLRWKILFMTTKE